jgi:BlaI family penicillinase repressor
METNKIPTNTELAILRVLWRLKTATVREVHEELNQRAALGYTSVLKMMQIMHKKGLVERDESQRSHIYRPSDAAADVQQSLVTNLIEKAFAGSAAELAVHALSTSGVTQDDLERVQEFLDEMGKRHGE